MRGRLLDTEKVVYGAAFDVKPKQKGGRDTRMSPGGGEKPEERLLNPKGQ